VWRSNYRALGTNISADLPALWEMETVTTKFTKLLRNYSVNIQQYSR
jgi:hypothetical protein